MLSLGLLIPAHMPVSRASGLTMTATVSGKEKAFADPVGDDVPLLLRAARGEKVERPPVWMMRQAGRHMQVYRDLVKEYPTFRQRSEIADVATEISLQPWRAYKTDGVILFSDILTPLPGMGIDFDILEKEGPKMPPLRTKEKIDAVLVGKDFDPEAACPFVKEALGNLRREVGNEATVLGFIGAPYTMATYCVEGGTSASYLQIKKMGYNEPELLHALLDKLASNLADYACYQIESGAQVIQMFDSWAGNLAPADYDIFAGPYQKKVVDAVKARHPDTPFIMYIAKSAALLERMAATGIDIVSVDWTVTMKEARERLGPDVGVQGNLESAVLLGNHKLIEERTLAVIREAGPTGHIMNLGHGIEATTPEENAKKFVDTVKAFRWSDEKA
jgi:uroporphyrinogen decarboxylase